MYDILELSSKLLPELREIAKGLKIKRPESLKKQDLIYKILDQQAIEATEKRKSVFRKIKLQARLPTIPFSKRKNRFRGGGKGPGLSSRRRPGLLNRSFQFLLKESEYLKRLRASAGNMNAGLKEAKKSLIFPKPLRSLKKKSGHRSGSSVIRISATGKTESLHLKRKLRPGKKRNPRRLLTTLFPWVMTLLSLKKANPRLTPSMR